MLQKSFLLSFVSHIIISKTLKFWIHTSLMKPNENKKKIFLPELLLSDICYWYLLVVIKLKTLFIKYIPNKCWWI